jgi:hypothetical protein
MWFCHTPYLKPPLIRIQQPEIFRVAMSCVTGTSDGYSSTVRLQAVITINVMEASKR